MYNYDKLCTKEIKKQIEKNELINLKLCIYSNRKYLTFKNHKEIEIQKEELLILDKVIKIASKMYDCDLNSFTKNSYPLKNITSFSKVPFNRLRYKIYYYLNN